MSWFYNFSKSPKKIYSEARKNGFHHILSLNIVQTMKIILKKHEKLVSLQQTIWKLDISRCKQQNISSKVQYTSELYLFQFPSHGFVLQFFNLHFVNSIALLLLPLFNLWLSSIFLSEYSWLLPGGLN